LVVRPVAFDTDERVARGSSLLKTEESPPVVGTPGAAVRYRTMIDYDTDELQTVVKNRTRIHDPLYLGTDGAGNAHFWSSYHRCFAVVEGDSVHLFHEDDTPVAGREGTLLPWCEAVRAEQGAWRDGPKIATTTADQTMAAVQQQ
jgi:hypothetical protein